MSNLRVLLLALLTAYIFAPTIFNWMTADDGSWYRPFIIWLVIIIATLLFQKYQHRT